MNKYGVLTSIEIGATARTTQYTGVELNDYDVTKPDEKYATSRVHDLSDVNIGVYFQCKSIVPKFSYEVKMRPQSYIVDEVKFEQLAKKYNDHDYNGYYWMRSPVLATEADYINVTTDIDFDSQHKAGANINEYVVANYHSSLPFIQTRYRNRRLEDFGAWQFSEPLETFNKLKVALLHDVVHMTFTERPEKGGIYRFKFTYSDVEGKVFSSTSIPIRLKGRNE